MGAIQRLERGLLAALLIAGVGCGRVSRVDDRNPGDDGINAPGPDSRNSGEAPGIVRGRWEIPVQMDSGAGKNLNPQSLSALQGANRTKPITATVAAQVTFTLSDSNFVTPAAQGVASYGRLDITDLRDNALRVCGMNGTTRCTGAGLRIYSSGTPQKGLWNTVDSYGAPILTGTQEVGLDAAGAAVLQTLALGTRGVLKITDFAASGVVQIPVSVNFSDAPAGSYASTLVVEYYLY